MIKTNELRKRNLIHYKGKVESVVGIDQDDYIIIDNDYYDDGIEHVKEGDGDPIPLSPEWLERCGFKDNGAYWEYNGEPCFVLLKDKEGAAYIGNPVRTYVKTVHHLQNLYFALTEGVELQIKMP